MKLRFLPVLLAAALMIFGCTEDTRVTINNSTDYKADIELDTLDYHVNAHSTLTIVIQPDSVGVEGGPVNLKATVNGFDIYAYTILDPGDDYQWDLFAGEGMVTVFNNTSQDALIKVDTLTYSLNPQQSRTSEIEWFDDVLNPCNLSLTATINGFNIYEYAEIDHGDEYVWSLYSGMGNVIVDNQSTYSAQVTIGGEEAWGLSAAHQRFYVYEWYNTNLDSVEVSLSALINYGDGSWNYYDYPKIVDGQTLKWTLMDNGVHFITIP